MGYCFVYVSVHMNRSAQRWTRCEFQCSCHCSCWFQWWHVWTQLRWHHTKDGESGRVVRCSVRWTRQTRRCHHVQWTTVHSGVHVMPPVLATTSRTHSSVITSIHLYWLQHQELTPCDHINTPVLASTSRTHSPVITSIHLYWLQHQELTHLWGVQLSTEDHRTCHWLHVQPGYLATVSIFRNLPGVFIVFDTLLIYFSLHNTQRWAIIVWKTPANTAFLLF